MLQVHAVVADRCEGEQRVVPKDVAAEFFSIEPVEPCHDIVRKAVERLENPRHALERRYKDFPVSAARHLSREVFGVTSGADVVHFAKIVLFRELFRKNVALVVFV